jgi:hypothetical protein
MKASKQANLREQKKKIEIKQEEISFKLRAMSFVKCSHLCFFLL